MMRQIVLSVDDNPDYAYFVPLVCWAWVQFGWRPLLMANIGNGSPSAPFNFAMSSIRNYVDHFAFRTIDGFRRDTITQVSRLYAAPHSDYPCYLMTGDIDMLPLSDYWAANENEITVWGHDLTGYGHYPICYIGMDDKKWYEVMAFTPDGFEHDIKRDLSKLPQAKSDDFYKYWFTDQDLITERLRPFNPVIKKRGQYSNGFAVGRVDRGAWSLDHTEFIDCHMFQQLYHKRNADKFVKTMELLTSIWPNEDFSWFTEYTKEFQRLTGNP